MSAAFGLRSNGSFVRVGAAILFADNYLRAGTLPSGALGIWVTRAPEPAGAPSVPVLASGKSGVRPIALRTSASILAVVSLFSLR